MEEPKPLLGISSCLLGKKVRYDGGHKLHHYLHDTLGDVVTWEPVCPEVECGMNIPREPVRLVGDIHHPRLITTRTNEDKTRQMQTWATKRLDELATLPLCGFIFKSGSPSSGMIHVKVYDNNGVPHADGTGLFAAAFMQRFPLLPVEDDGRLNNALIRETFLDHVFTLHRFRQLQKNATITDLIDFHSRHKLLYMSHSPEGLKTLGNILANHEKQSFEDLLASYELQMTSVLREETSRNKHTNVLQHALGYFRHHLSEPDRKELLELITHYHDGLVPLIVPITLVNHHTRHLDIPYLHQQIYLHPHPDELMLRNHI